MTSPDIQLQSKTIIPPVMGWNTKDALSAMGPEYAVEAENFFSEGSSVDLRSGSLIYGTGYGASVLLAAFEYIDSSGTHYFLAFNDKVWNTSASGAATDITGAGTVDGAGEVYCVNFKGRVYMKGYNAGSDSYYWAGSGNITAAAFTGPSGDDKALWRITIYKNRIYFLGFDASTWYADVNALTGALTQFDFASQLRLGGTLWFHGSLSQSNNNNEERFVVISEAGEVLIYSGDYPGSAATWGLVGRYYIAPPVGRRSFFYWGTDIIVITRTGLISLSDVIAAGARSDFSALSDTISTAFKSALQITNALDRYRVCGIYYPNGPYLLINGVDPTSGNAIQLIMNTLTRSWWKFTGLKAYTWAIYNNNLYFSSDSGPMVKADTGNYDEDPANAGVKLARTIKLRPAYNYFGDTESFKQFTFCIPTVYQDNQLSITIDANVDYENVVATSANTDTKGTAYQIYQPRCGLRGIGKAASIRIDGTVTDKRSSLQAIEVFWCPADPA